ncbi:hypothetical protein DJ69_15620 [Halorubrum persicum]|uniref:C2H2-type domain-containing protein n=1 Tax=Halorubrum persicum TaxID=1383844 RepID=A0A2G1WF93_9EURY|nr:DUF5906 domain-containing protein [Halorubrum persicum]PHQ37651.1 hypothetical protein DJ69_15620 [Halorubrum persicum]
MTEDVRAPDKSGGPDTDAAKNQRTNTTGSDSPAPTGTGDEAIDAIVSRYIDDTSERNEHGIPDSWRDGTVSDIPGGTGGIPDANGVVLRRAEHMYSRHCDVVVGVESGVPVTVVRQVVDGLPHGSQDAGISTVKVIIDDDPSNLHDVHRSLEPDTLGSNTDEVLGVTDDGDIVAVDPPETETGGEDRAGDGIDADTLEDLAGGEDVTLADGTVIGEKTDSMIDPYECGACGKAFESEHGLKTHYGSQHSGVDDEEREKLMNGDFGPDTTDPDTGESLPGDDESETLSQRSREKNKAEQDVPELWGEAEWRYQAASMSSSDIRKPDARDAVVTALEAQDDWLSIRERCQEGNTHLARYDPDESGSGAWTTDNIYTYVLDESKDRLGSTITDTEAAHIILELASRNRVSEDDVNAGDDDRLLVPVANGTLDLSDAEYDTGTHSVDLDSVELLEPDKSRMWQYRIDTEYDPDSADLDGLDEWVKEITHDHRDDDRRMLWEWIGHALHPEYPTDGFLVLIGDGGSGKSQFLGLNRKMVGEHNTTARSIKDLQSRFGKVNGALSSVANINTELSGTKQAGIGPLKSMTANEPTFVEDSKGDDGSEQTNTTTMIFASDNPPAFGQSNRALGRRLYPVEFPMEYCENPDPENPYELQARPKHLVESELQEDEARQKAALVRAVQGLVRLMEEGNPTTDLEWEERIGLYNSYADPIADFRRSCLKKAPDAPGIHTNDLSAAYDRFAKLNGHEGKTKRTLVEQLQKLDIPMRKQRTRTYTPGESRDVIYQGITFTEDAVKFFLEEDAHWDAGLYREYVSIGTIETTEQDGLDTDSSSDADGSGVAVGDALDMLRVRAAGSEHGRSAGPRSAVLDALAVAGIDEPKDELDALRLEEGAVYVEDGEVRLTDPVEADRDRDDNGDSGDSSYESDGDEDDGLGGDDGSGDEDSNVGGCDDTGGELGSGDAVRVDTPREIADCVLRSIEFDPHYPIESTVSTVMATVPRCESREAVEAVISELIEHGRIEQTGSHRFRVVDSTAVNWGNA